MLKIISVYLLFYLVIFYKPGIAGNNNHIQHDEDYEISQYRSKIKLQVLNKITAKSVLLSTVIDNTEKFGNLTFVVKNCFNTKEFEFEESKASLLIWEEKPDEKSELIFSGWMFSNSPGISLLQHPVYDISLVSCE